MPTFMDAHRSLPEGATAVATGPLSGSNAEGFRFTTAGTASSAEVSSVFGIPGWAEMGIERNESFLR
jgi:hypothetical protein